MRLPIVVLIGSLCCVSANGQSATIADRLREASAKSSLQETTSRPWHLKLDVTVFDDLGKNPQLGTIEVWQGKNDRRTAIQFGTATKTSLLADGLTYFESNGDVPFRASMVLDQILHPGPTDAEIAQSSPDLRKTNFGNVQLDCVMLGQPLRQGVAYPPIGVVQATPLGLFPTYCLDQKTNVILATYNFGGQTILVGSFGGFLDHDIITKMTMVDGNVTVATTKVLILTTYIPSADEFTSTPKMTRSGGIARIGSAVMAGTILKKDQPVYPESAKQKHVEGTVVIRAIIGKDGHIHLLQVKSSPDPDLSLAAIAAVRKWTYKPYLLNGEATEVDTTITVNFHLGGG